MTHRWRVALMVATLSLAAAGPLRSAELGAASSRSTATDPLPDMPPSRPDGDTPTPNPPASGVAECLRLLRRLTDPLHEHIDRTLVSHSAKWGTLLRADFSTPPERDEGVVGHFVCPMETRAGARRPIVMDFDLDTPPLTSGPWGMVTTYK